MPDPHTHEQVQGRESTQCAVAAPATATPSVIHGTGPGLVATDAVRRPSPVMDALISGCGLPVRFCLWPVVCGHG